MYPDPDIENRKHLVEAKARRRAEKDATELQTTLQRWDRDETFNRLRTYKRRLRWILPLSLVLLVIGASGGINALADRFGHWVRTAGIIVLFPLLLICFIHWGLIAMDVVRLLWTDRGRK